MSTDDKIDDIVDLSERRKRLAEEVAAEGFVLSPYSFDADAGIGYVDEGVVMMVPPLGQQRGLIMSRRDAEELGLALIQAAAHIEPDDEEPDPSG